MMRVLRFTKIGYSIDSYNLSGVITKLVEGSKKRDKDSPKDTIASIAYSLARCGGGS